MFNFDNVIKFVPEIVLIFTMFVQFILSFFSKRRIANIVSLSGMFISAMFLFYLSVNKDKIWCLSWSNT